MTDSQQPGQPTLPVRVPALWLLWALLAPAYLLASITGQRVWALACVSLMIGALLAASGRRLVGVAAGAGLAIACLKWSDSMIVLVYAPPLAAFAFMAWFFSRTLRPGSEPLITRVARRDQPDLPADVQRYTRLLTCTWAIAFAALFAFALLLAPVASLPDWSRWVQGLGYAVPSALFLGEYIWRHHRFPQRKHSSIPTLIANIIAASKAAALEPRARPPADTGNN